jgi:ERF superfamily.
LKEIARKLAVVAKKCAYVQKDGRNDFHKYKYASAGAILEKVNDALSEQEIAAQTKLEIVNIDSAATKREGETQRVIVKVIVTLVDSGSGEMMVFEGMGCGTDSGDKAVMKAQTAAIKYAYMIGLNIETGDDPEADVTTDEKTQSKSGSEAPRKSQARPQPNKQSESQNPNLATQAQVKKMFATAKDKGLSPEEIKVDLAEMTGKSSTTELTVAEASTMIDMYEKMPTKSA